MREKTYGDILAECEQAFADAGLEEYRADAWVLFSYYFGMDLAKYFMERECVPKDSDAQAAFAAAVRKRLENVPVQYITGVQDFMGMPFRVNPDVLIPRQDTEVLAEQVLACAEGKRVLDMCTGSGCIIISLAKLANLQCAVGVDISPRALQTARENADALQTRVDFIQSDLFADVSGEYDIIVSNPPYISQEEFAALAPSVREMEPELALLGGGDGLEFYRRIAVCAGDFLCPDGRIFLEIGCGQGESVCGLLQEQGFADVKVTKDLAGLDRVVSAKKP